MLDFTYTDEGSEIDINSFENIWKNYIMPLKNKELIRDNGTKNLIVDVNWSGIKRITSNGKPTSINIEIFREAYNLIIQQGSISREYVNQNYTDRASSGVMLILSQLPFLELRSKPIRLHLRNID